MALYCTDSLQCLPHTFFAFQNLHTLQGPVKIPLFTEFSQISSFRLIILSNELTSLLLFGMYFALPHLLKLSHLLPL